MKILHQPKCECVNFAIFLMLWPLTLSMYANVMEDKEIDSSDSTLNVQSSSLLTCSYKCLVTDGCCAASYTEGSSCILETAPSCNFSASSKNGASTVIMQLIDDSSMKGDGSGTTRDYSSTTENGLSTRVDDSSTTGLGTTRDDSSTIEDSLGTTGYDSSTTEDGLSTTGDYSTTTRDGLGITGDDSSTTRDGLSTTGDDSTTTGDGLGTTGDDSSTTGNGFGTPRNDSSTTGDGLSTTRDDSSTTEDDLSTTADDFSTTRVDVSTADFFPKTKGHSTTTQFDSSTTDCDITTSQDSYSTTKKGHSTMEEGLATKEDEITTLGLDTNTTNTDLNSISTTDMLTSTQFGFHRYIIPSEHATMTNAKNACIGLGRKLVEIETAEEALFLHDLLTLNGGSWYWIGAYNYNADSVYEWWSDPDSPMTYTNWGNNQPMKTDTQPCVYVISPDFTWKTNDCSTYIPYVCEIIP